MPRTVKELAIGLSHLDNYVMPEMQAAIQPTSGIEGQIFAATWVD
jgi:hypothetical protein